MEINTAMGKISEYVVKEVFPNIGLQGNAGWVAGGLVGAMLLPLYKIVQENQKLLENLGFLTPDGEVQIGEIRKFMDNAFAVQPTVKINTYDILPANYKLPYFQKRFNHDLTFRKEDGEKLLSYLES